MSRFPIFMEFDKAGAEWVVVAYLSGDANMIHVIEEGESPHVHTGHLMTGVPKVLIEREHKLLDTATDAEHITQVRAEHFPELLQWKGFVPRTMSVRQMGKKSNHGLNYGMTKREAAYQWEMGETEAEMIIRLYHRAYPSISTVWWEDDIKAALRRDRTVYNVFGRKRVFRDAWGDDLFKAAYAYQASSTIVDLVLRAMVEIYNSPDPLLRNNLELLTQTHDSFLGQFWTRDWTEAAAAALLICEHLNPLLSYRGRDFRVATEMKVGPSWGHTVKIKPTQDVREMADRMEQAWRQANELRFAEEGPAVQ